MKRFLFRWLYRLSWVPGAIGFLLLVPMLWLEGAIDWRDGL